jgi:hypothetical protein
LDTVGLIFWFGLRVAHAPTENAGKLCDFVTQLDSLVTRIAPNWKKKVCRFFFCLVTVHSAEQFV